MSETEVESLVVRLTGDGSEYAKMLKDSQVQTQEAAAQVQIAAGKIEQISGSLKGFAQGALSALGALGAGAWLKEALGNFQEAETIGLQLNAVLETNGRQVEVTRARYEAFAAEIENITTHEDDAVLAMLRTAETFNVTGAAAEEAVRSSIALAAATGGSAENMIRLTAALAQGNIEQAMQFSRMVPQLRGIRDESEFVARAQQLIAGGMKAAAAETESSAGAMKLLKRDYGNMLEDIGKIVADTIQPVIKGVRETIAWFRKLPDSVKQGITFVAMLAVAVLSVAAAITIAGAVFNTMFGGIGLIIGLVVTAGVAISVWVAKLQGVSKAWDFVKQKSQQFLDWLKPAIDAIVAVVGIAWEAIKEYAGPAWEWIKKTVVSTMTKIVTKVREATVAIGGFISRNRDLAVTLGLVASAAAILYGAYKLVILAYSVASAILTYFHIQQIIGIVLWAAWKVATLAAAAVMTVFSISVGLGIVSLVLLVATIFAGVVAGIALVETVGSVIDILSDLSTTSGPLKVISDLFGEWRDIFKDVFRAAKNDMPLAWALLKAGFNLAVLQVKALWPPLWTFIQHGFGTLWDATKDQFVLSFKTGLEIAAVEALKFANEAAGNSTAPMDAALLEIRRRHGVLSRDIRNDASSLFEQGVVRFQGSINLDTPEIRAARAEVAKLRNLVTDTPVATTLEDEIKKQQQTIRDELKKTTQEAERFDAAIRGSAEGVARILAYQDRLRATRPGGAGGSGMSANMSAGISSPSIASSSSPTPINSSVPQDASRDRMIALLTSIDRYAAIIASRPPLTLSPSNIIE